MSYISNYVKNKDGHDYITKGASSEVSIVVNQDNHCILDGNALKSEALNYELQFLSSNNGEFICLKVVSESAFKAYVNHNKLMETADSRERSKHGLKTFEIAKKLFQLTKDTVDVATHNKLKKAVFAVRKTKVIELLQMHEHKNEKQIAGKLVYLSNLCAGVKNTKTLTTVQANTIIQYVKDVNPSIILGCR